MNDEAEWALIPVHPGSSAADLADSSRPDHPAEVAGRASWSAAQSGLARAAAAARQGERDSGQFAEILPIARVLVDVGLAHLDRSFDYLVPHQMADAAVIGARVKVRFAGQDVAGFIVARVATSDHPRRLTALKRVVSPEPVLTPEIAAVSAALAERYAGTRSDILRLAVPPRHARVEAQPSLPAAQPAVVSGPGVFCDYSGGVQWVASLRAHAADDTLDQPPTGAHRRAVWTVLPGADWALGLAQAAAMTLQGGAADREAGQPAPGVVLCVPDARDLAHLDAALTEVLGAGVHVTLSADAGPAARYRAFLALSRGKVRVVAGTRSAAFAPVGQLGLVAMWDDGDDLFCEPRAPYPHAREVLLSRAHHSGAAVLLAGYSRSVEAHRLVASGFACELKAERSLVRHCAPHTAITGATDLERARDPAVDQRLPSAVMRAIGAGLEQGPVLVQNPRAGYATHLVCQTCRAAARCGACAGPLEFTGPGEPLSCRWCARVWPHHACPDCGSSGTRAVILGERRTGEELGRAFPKVVVRTSGGDKVLERVPPTPALVIATPGAEPLVEGGYAAVVVLDTWLTLARADLRSTEEAARRWFNALALARPSAQGGHAVVVGAPEQPILQGLVRWDPAGVAARETADRQSAHLPPLSRLATLIGNPKAVAEFAGALEHPPGTEVLGPVDATPDREGNAQVMVVVRVPRAHGAALSKALRAVQGLRSARKSAPVRVQVDPYSLA